TRPIRERSTGELAQHERVDRDLPAGDPLGERRISQPEEIDPDRGVGEDHFRRPLLLPRGAGSRTTLIRTGRSSVLKAYRSSSSRSVATDDLLLEPAVAVGMAPPSAAN